ncbi:LysM peptidoglycan-binding domain-containing protein [Pseudarthrobacter sp. P1]|uniref:LysM peptidoglycan-binding domain-containing protein n=1 Tax=Pseudarthrobacter sp. P1 TaxID=3418418 RepID=UPI003CEED4AE
MSPTPALPAGETVKDSFGNVLFYTTVAGDEAATLAQVFKISLGRLEMFNALAQGTPLAPGTKLRLLPPPGPDNGARGEAELDNRGIPVTYTVATGDNIEGISYRFGMAQDQLAEANKATLVQSVGIDYFLIAGTTIELQKKPVDSRSGRGQTISNSVGRAIYYTAVDGDSIDSLGYQFRRPAAQLLKDNPQLAVDAPIPAGTRVTLMPNARTIPGAAGTFTADARGIPLTYTTAPGDVDSQIAARFGLERSELRMANSGSSRGGMDWFQYTDASNRELVPGQTISLSTEFSIRGPLANK